MGRLFGTDGIRGIANTELSCSLAMKIARAAATVCSEELGYSPTVLVGSDTRISAGMLVAAINAGLSSVGANSINIGVVPTPAIAYLVKQEHADMGIMISASHNPYDFNGIKIFGPEGYKLTDQQEFMIEEIVLDKIKPYPITWGDQIGRITTDYSRVDHYVVHLLESVQGISFTDYKIALDCSNGSASSTATKLFESLGTTVKCIHCTPDGININDHCGSTHMESLCDCVKTEGFDVGFAFDGDADRCLMVDETGSLVDGDQIMALLALDLRSQGKLKDDTFVATVMSNMGLFRFAEENGLRVEKTKVGDRYVLERMLKDHFVLGGEQSGHVIMTEFMTTGDGQLTALQVLAAMARSGKKTSELAAVMTVYPQAMKNIQADSSMKALLSTDEGVQNIITKAEQELGTDGRILVRPSGTEPLIRVMLEGRDKQQITNILECLVEDITERLNLLQSQKPIRQKDE